MRTTIFLLCALVAGSLAHAGSPAGDVIKIGMVNDQTGPNKGSGRGMKVGVNAYFKAINEKGGVNGRKIELINLDDQYVNEKTIDCLLKLVEEHKVFAVVGSVGSSNCVASLPIVKEYKLPFINPRTGASDLRTPVIREVINVRASYQQEVDRLVDVLVKEGGAKRFAVFYQNDTLGTDILGATEAAVKRHGLSLVAKGSCEKGTTAVTAGLASIMAGKPDAVILGAVYAPSAEFIKLATKEGLKAYYAVGSFAGGSNLIKAAGPGAEGVIMSQVVPHLDDLSVPITRECKDAIDKSPEDVGFNVVTMEGCMAAKSMVMALEKAGNPPTRDAFIKAYESMKDADMGGIKLTFSPDNHQGQSNVYLQVVQSGKLADLKGLRK